MKNFGGIALGYSCDILKVGSNIGCMSKQKKKLLIHFTPEVAARLRNRVRQLKEDPSISVSNSRIVDLAISLYLMRDDESIQNDLRHEGRIVALERTETAASETASREQFDPPSGGTHQARRSKIRRTGG